MSSSPEQNWLWHNLFVFGPQTATEGSAALDQYIRVTIDSKAQRKFRIDDTLAFVWDMIRITGTPTADGIAAVRSLVLVQ